MTTPALPPGRGTKQRVFEYSAGKQRESVLTLYDPLTGKKSSESRTPVPTGLYGREITSSERGSNWLSYQAALRDYGPDAPNMRWLSTMDLGTAPFHSVKRTMEFSGSKEPKNIVVQEREGPYEFTYSGPYAACDVNVGSSSSLYPPIPGDLNAAMLRKGATAIARTIPTNPVAGAAQFLGELREGVTLPGASLARRRNLGGAADEYINVEFGLKPIVSDLRKFGEAARTADKVIRQLRRDSGRLIRRRYTFPEEKTTSMTVVSTNAYGSPALRIIGPACYNGGPGQLIRTREETRRFWFSGAYTYLYPEGDNALAKARQAESRLNRLFGTRVSPELLWELTPWSWAADWVSNMGDVIHNVSAFAADGLVLRWGYIMCHYTCRDTYLLTGVAPKSASGPFSQTFQTDVKQRLKATPYGFGLDLSGFTTRQWAILGALGISRAQGML